MAAGAATPLPIVAWFPALGALPRAALARVPTPVEWANRIAPGLWIKRDDLSGTIIGGNKVRALEFLLGGLAAGDEVVTVGAVGSTHALATALYARALGLRCTVALWPQEMNPMAAEVARALERAATTRRVFPHPLLALAWAAWRGRRAARLIPGGGSTPLGILGHVNAALECAEQIRRGDAPHPDRVVVPLGTGGTAAGLLLGFRIAGLDTTVIGARVVPRIVARRGRVMRLADDTARLIERQAGVGVPRVDARRLAIVHAHYGGAYGRAAAGGNAAERSFAAGDIRLDTTYSAKASAVALDACASASGASGVTLLWLTFDAAAIASGRADPS